MHLGVKGDPEGRSLTFIAGKPDCLVVQVGLLDPADAPAGYSTIDIFTLLGHDEARQWFPEEGDARDEWRDHRRSEFYLRGKEGLADILIARAEQALPGLRERIVFRCEASPVTYARYDWSSAGAVYGVAPEGRLNGSKSPIRGLVVAGAMNSRPRRRGRRLVRRPGGGGAFAGRAGALRRERGKPPFGHGRLKFFR